MFSFYIICLLCMKKSWDKELHGQQTRATAFKSSRAPAVTAAVNYSSHCEACEAAAATAQAVCLCLQNGAVHPVDELL